MKGRDEQGIAEKADRDRGGAAQDGGGEPDPAGQPPVPVFGEVDAGDDADRDGEDGGESDHDRRSRDPVGDPAARDTGRVLEVAAGEEGQVPNRGQTADDGVPEHEAERDEGEQRRPVNDGASQRIDCEAAPVHGFWLPRVARGRSRASRFTVSVTPISTAPSSTRAELCIGAVVSVNSLAMTAARV